MPDRKERRQQRPGVQKTIEKAVHHHRLGQLDEAARLYQQVLQRQPGHFDALHLLGTVRAQARQYEAALDLIRRALEQQPRSADAHFNLGLVLASLHREAEAVASFDTALSIRPTYPEAQYHRANALQALGLHADAVAAYDGFLGARPEHASAWYNRGNSLTKLDRHEEALKSYDKTLGLQPAHAKALSNRGIVLSTLHRYDEAVASYDQALAVDPDYADACSNRGNALRCLNRHAEAIASYDRAIAIDPRHLDALINRGNALQALQRYEQAIEGYDLALGVQADCARALYNKGNALQASRQYRAAAACYDRAVALEPYLDEAMGNALHSHAHICDWHNYDDTTVQLIGQVRAGRRVSPPFAFLAVSPDVGDQLACARSFVAAGIPRNLMPLWNGTLYKHDRIRLAYLSADFHDHATAYLIAELLERHERSRFEVIGISYGPDAPSAWRSRLRQAFELFVDVRAQSDLDIARLLREREIDIAIDLKGFTGDCRAGILAYRPAPIQVNYLGYPGTMAAEFIDYIIADRVVIPEEHFPFYTEKVVYLPDTYQVNDSTRRIAERISSRTELGLPEQGFVFCCFNSNYKITPAVFDVWMRLLRKVEGSVLWLLEGNAEAASNLRREAQIRGVDPGRLVFAPRAKLPEHLARHRLADLFLDTQPYNAHTTASDALWAGLPVLTCLGTAFAGRVAASLLQAIGLPELITQSMDEYEALVLKLATDPARLAGIRDKLAQNRLTAPLFDTDRFRRHIEAAYTTMWEIHQRGEKPKAFAVAPVTSDGPSARSASAPAPAGRGHPGTMPQAIRAAAKLREAGNLREAERVCREVLRTQPEEFSALHLLGILCAQLGRAAEAVEILARAVNLRPRSAAARCDLGFALHALGRHEDAVARYENALAIKPDFVAALYNRGIALAALHRYDEAVASYDRALEIQSGHAEAHNNRGAALAKLDFAEKAIESYDRALAIRPAYADAHFNRGAAFAQLHRHADAVACFDQALAIDPKYADALFARGRALMKLNRKKAAIASYDRALALEPNRAEIHNSRGNALAWLGRHKDALESYRRALALDGGYRYAYGRAAHCRLHICDWNGYDALKTQLAEGVRAGKPVDTPFSFLALSENLEDQLACAAIFVREKFPTAAQSLWEGRRSEHRRIRLAYLSADFHNHATAHLMARLFELHDRSRFEVSGLSFGPNAASPMRTRLKEAFDDFIDVRHRSDREIANLLSGRGIDIAIDLKGFTTDSRTRIFAYRPAPIQVNYLGYPGTMAAEFIDYIIADRVVIPQEHFPFYTEKVVHLPDTYQVNDSTRRIAERTPSRTELGLPEQGIVFCCFNSNYKITPAVFDVWMRLLRKVEGSVLWLLEGNAEAATNLRREAKARGVDPGRLVFAPRAKLPEHLARHRLADLFLDTLPVNAHTTASDALWAGLPVLTCLGTAFAGRVAASLLQAIGLPELITQSMHEYEALALRLATDPARLQSIRDKLARNRLTAPLFDTDRFRRHIEAAYTTMWEIHQQGEKPRPFQVAPPAFR